ncbi:uncharacterized protein MKZ38_004122 [Zalerion maritima]|uniref:Sterol regulatory element-binding protein cleavage-activating protein n=1 Tax=Zalerion maritima TaxID=339359 RepID=A0AAD5WPT0_9PEZI|nr:uncharacterized protein MKZ38_004122 [Zalerion maritima]
MIWYLLYPIRGTTEPLILEPANALRRAFSRYASYASHHVATTLIVSIAVATILVYPFPFLYTNDFTNGASNLPHHVWTDAEPLGSGAAVGPDVVMRSIWVHGSYMRALEKDVLLGGLELQDELLGSTRNFDPRVRPDSPLKPLPTTYLNIPERNSFHVFNGLTSQSWFFHSPLQYWNGSRGGVLSDPDVVATINKQRSQPTSVNTTLRHSIVFSGKNYEDRQLVAADALVVTLIHLRESPVGVQWERRARDLASDPDFCAKWDIYPPEGHGMQSRLYEFRFLPLSAKDRIVLATAYIFIITYVIWTLSKLRAVRSKSGLVVAILVQIVFSVISSFTVCAVLEIDLSRVPHAAYPFVMLALGLEHIFRLINAVIATHPDDPTASRISYAYGETAFVSIISCIQNTLFLLGLSLLVRPPVAAFCIFTAIAIPIDFFFLSTFFLAVLSVDVRRNELCDSLAKESMSRRGCVPDAQKSPSPVENLLQGRVAFSTRTAGTIVVFISIMVAQWHFLDLEVMSSVWKLFVSMVKRADKQFQPGSKLLLDIHQARSPTSWLRLQDHQTTEELIQVVKPESHSFVALVYDPLVFVMKGSNRIPPQYPSTTVPPAVADFIHHQLGAFFATLVVLLFAMRYLVRILLVDDPESAGVDANGDGSPLVITTLNHGHLLDVVRLTPVRDGKLVSVALDRQIRVWDLRTGLGSYAVQDPDSPRPVPCPVLGMAADRDSNWLAIVSPTRVDLWNLREARWGPWMSTDMRGSKAELVFFAPDPEALIEPICVLRKDGVLMELRVEEGVTQSTEICKIPISSAQLLPETTLSGARVPERIITAAKKGCTHVATRSYPAWMCENISLFAGYQDVDKIVALPPLNAFFVSRSNRVELYDINNDRLVHQFDTGHIHRHSLRCHYTPRRHGHSGLPGLAGLTLAYVSLDTRELCLDTYAPTEDAETICFLDPGTAGRSSGCRWEGANLTRRTVRNPGTWTTLPCGAVVGVRRKSAARFYAHPPASTPGIPSTDSPSSRGLRRRAAVGGRTPPRLVSSPASRSQRDGASHCFNRQAGHGSGNSTIDNNNDWEVWMMSHLDGDELVEEAKTPLCPKNDGHLFVSSLGPMINVGKESVAVALGDVVKVISIGHARFGEDAVAMDMEFTLRAELLSARAKRKHRRVGSRRLIA